ncbi:MAG: hypothetical protein Q8P86_03040 [bacterium]|nr:hypothetical protein [bacterium]
MNRTTSNKRQEEIEEIIGNLKELKRDEDKNKEYAIDANIAFFTALLSYRSFLRWFIFHCSQVDGVKLLELTDFNNASWKAEFYKQMILFEKDRFPYFIRPLVNRLVQFIKSQSRDVVVASFGCGPMEIERQVLKRLESDKFPHSVTFVGFDTERVAIDFAKRNLSSLETLHINVDEFVGANNLKGKIQGQKKAKYSVLLTSVDVFDLPVLLGDYKFDILFHSLFRHHVKHLSHNLENLTRRISQSSIEYDGYRSFWRILPPSIEFWNSPVFLNSAVFSNLRYDQKSEVMLRKREGFKLSFFPQGTYLLEYS